MNAPNEPIDPEPVSDDDEPLSLGEIQYARMAEQHVSDYRERAISQALYDRLDAAKVFTGPQCGCRPGIKWRPDDMGMPTNVVRIHTCGRPDEALPSET